MISPSPTHLERRDPNQESLRLHSAWPWMTKGCSMLLTNSFNHRVQKFTPEGEFIAEFGKKGTGEGELIKPCGIAVDTITGNVYVSSYHKISTFSSTGKFITEFGGEGPGEAEFNSPCGLALDESTGHLHICDFRNKRLVSY